MINWGADPWFVKYHHHRLTDDLKEVWLKFYGEPTDYIDNEEEQHTYWIRCAFFLEGWITRGEIASSDLSDYERGRRDMQNEIIDYLGTYEALKCAQIAASIPVKKIKEIVNEQVLEI